MIQEGTCIKNVCFQNVRKDKLGLKLWSLFFSLARGDKL